jgi:DNA-binding transcriptional regulator LsrR (DeoR family)
MPQPSTSVHAAKTKTELHLLAVPAVSTTALLLKLLCRENISKEATTASSCPPALIGIGVVVAELLKGVVGRVSLGHHT